MLETGPVPPTATNGIRVRNREGSSSASTAVAATRSGSVSSISSPMLSESAERISRESGDGPLNINIATLNCWALPQPWPIGSSDRRLRLDALVEVLRQSDYDIVCLQELWSEDDFLDIADRTSHLFRHKHYFHSGYTGSGTCILSRWKIQSTLIHRYSLNGFPHHIHRGDWFGGKVVGLAEIDADGYKLCVYTTHLHAEYNRDNDLYLPHRLAQAFELAQFVRHTSRDADLIILTGDFNIEPEDLGYHVIRNLANLRDAWLDRKVTSSNERDTGMTCDRPDNCYTGKAVLKTNPQGKRLDYIMYQSIRKPFSIVSCKNCFDIIPGTMINYSDHLGVEAQFRLDVAAGGDKADWAEPPVDIDYRFLERAQDILSEGEKRIIWDRRFFGAICFLVMMLIFGISQIASADSIPFGNALIIIGQIVLTLLLGFSFWHGMVFLTIERRAITETKWNIDAMLGT
uniref:sphingomyelin phosphodiesterase n=1 Tax=Panagrellus redivivus TaxID=6233 RepID=A0A7E4USR3_PANRE